jgi:hypothetical protein
MYTPRLPLLVAWHASKYYPGFSIDWREITRDFFKKFYGVEYSVQEE